MDTCIVVVPKMGMSNLTTLTIDTSIMNESIVDTCIFVTGCVKMYENRWFENVGANKADQALSASLFGAADDTPSQMAYGSAIPAEPPSPVITVSAALAFRKHRCENTP